MSSWPELSLSTSAGRLGELHRWAVWCTHLWCCSIFCSLFLQATFSLTSPRYMPWAQHQPCHASEGCCSWCPVLGVRRASDRAEPSGNARCWSDCVSIGLWMWLGKQELENMLSGRQLLPPCFWGSLGSAENRHGGMHGPGHLSLMGAPCSHPARHTTWFGNLALESDQGAHETCSHRGLC